MEFLHANGVMFLYMIGAALGVGLFGILALATPKLFALLEAYISAHVTSTLAVRINEALTKLEHITENLVAAESTLFKTEVLDAVKAGKLDNEAIAKIAKDLAAKALEMLKPDLDILKGYFVGEKILDFLVANIQGKITNTVMSRLGVKEGNDENDPLASSPAQ